MARLTRWNAYIIAGKLKIYLRKNMTTTEALKWVTEKCINKNGDRFMCGFQVFCERR